VTWLPRVRRTGLDTILDVLLDNALHHGIGTVRLAVEPREDSVRISVTDEGRCDQSDEELFTRSTSRAGRTGIGLDLARTIATTERGELLLGNRAPTTFTLELPAAADTGAAFTDL
jgi:signal transduction histidine kinase